MSRGGVALEVVGALLDPRAWVHRARLMRYTYLHHVRQRSRLQVTGPVRISPTADFRNAERVCLGEGTRVGEWCSLWAGDATGRIVIGPGCLLAPYVFITASDYGLRAGLALLDQPKVEADVRVGRDVWLGTGVVVTAGVTIGDGAVVGAQAVVTADVPAGAVVGGVPARVIGQRSR